MTTCAGGIITITIVSAAIIVGLMAFTIRRVWRVADEVRRQIDEERSGFEGAPQSTAPRSGRPLVVVREGAGCLNRQGPWGLRTYTGGRGPGCF